MWKCLQTNRQYFKMNSNKVQRILTCNQKRSKLASSWVSLEFALGLQTSVELLGSLVQWDFAIANYHVHIVVLILQTNNSFLKQRASPQTAPSSKKLTLDIYMTNRVHKERYFCPEHGYGSRNVRSPLVQKLWAQKVPITMRPVNGSF